MRTFILALAALLGLTLASPLAALTPTPWVTATPTLTPYMYTSLTVSPAIGSTDGTTYVNVFIGAFSAGVVVYFDNVPMVETSRGMTWVGGFAPAHAAGAVDVRIADPAIWNYNDTLVGGFTYVAGMTKTITQTSTNTATRTPTPSFTMTPTRTGTACPACTATQTRTDTITAGPTATFTVTPTAGPAVAFSKSLVSGNGLSGTQATYRLDLDVANSGTAFDNYFWDTLPTGTSFSSAVPAPASVVGNVVSWYLWSITSHQSLTVVVDVLADGPICNGAQYSSAYVSPPGLRVSGMACVPAGSATPTFTPTIDTTPGCVTHLGTEQEAYFAADYTLFGAVRNAPADLSGLRYAGEGDAVTLQAGQNAAMITDMTTVYTTFSESKAHITWKATVPGATLRFNYQSGLSAVGYGPYLELTPAVVGAYQTDTVVLPASPNIGPYILYYLEAVGGAVQLDAVDFDLRAASCYTVTYASTRTTTISPTRTASASQTPSATRTATAPAVGTVSSTPTQTPVVTPGGTLTMSPTATPLVLGSATKTPTPTFTRSATTTGTPCAGCSATVTQTITPSQTFGATATFCAGCTGTPSATRTATSTFTRSSTPTMTPGAPLQGCIYSNGVSDGFFTAPSDSCACWLETVPGAMWEGPNPGAASTAVGNTFIVERSIFIPSGTDLMVAAVDIHYTVDDHVTVSVNGNVVDVCTNPGGTSPCVRDNGIRVPAAALQIGFNTIRFAVQDEWFGWHGISYSICWDYTGLATPTPSATITPALSHTITRTLSTTATFGATATFCAGCTGTPSQTPSATRTGTPSMTGTPCAGCTSTVTPTHTPTQSFGPTATFCAGCTGTPSQTPSATRTGTPGMTGTPCAGCSATVTPTHTPTQSFGPTATFCAGCTGTPSATRTGTPVDTATPCAACTATPTITVTFTPIGTATPCALCTGTMTRTVTPTRTVTCPCLPATATPTSTPCGACTSTLSPTITVTPSATPTGCAACSVTTSPTRTLTGTPTMTRTMTRTITPSFSVSPTVTACSPCATFTETMVPTGATPTRTPTITGCVAAPTPMCVYLFNWAPVCGCNGVTYSNSAHAACNGINTYTMGVCPGYGTPTPTMVPPPTGTTYPFPVPASGLVNIAFTVTQGADVRIEVLNSAGTLVTVQQARLSPGSGSVSVALNGFATGIYYYSAKLTYDDGSVSVLAPKVFVVGP